VEEVKSSSKPRGAVSNARINLPPYFGTGAVVVVVIVEVVALVVDTVVVTVLVFVGLWVDVDAEIDVGVDVVDMAQDASSMATTIKKLQPTQINFFFIS